MSSYVYEDINMKKIFLASILLACFSFGAIAQEKSPYTSESAAAQEREMELRKELAYLAAPIKSAEDLREYLYSSNFHTGPLKKLSEAGRQRFIGSLTFNEKGLTGFRYEDLKAELTVSQIYKILSLFGAQDSTASIKGLKPKNKLEDVIVLPQIFWKDYEDFACTSRATCSRAIGSICMSGC
jgi:hypothetical protein